MRAITIIFAVIAIISTTVVKADDDSNMIEDGPTPCRCGVYLTGQIPKTPGEEPKGNAALQTEAGPAFPNNAFGNRQCMNKCLEHIVKHLPKSADIICATLGRDCHKERAYLFIQNYLPKWVNSNMSAGREYCCKDNVPYKCPVV